MPRRPVPGTLRFIFIGVVLMLLADHFIFGGKRSYIEDAKAPIMVKATPAPKPPPVRIEPEDGSAYFESPMSMPAPQVAAVAPIQDFTAEITPKKIEPAPVPESAPKIEAQPVAVMPPPIHGSAKIAIIIDDVGMDIKHSKQVIDLPAPVTLAMLPYAPRVRELATAAKEKGHSLIIHVPMEAMDSSVNIGPGGLKSGMNAAQFNAAFTTMLNSFDGYDGINNHMGSRLTQDSAKMDLLMARLKEKNLFFVDSKTTGASVASHEAAQGGVSFADRDVFLDHVETAGFTQKALAEAERIAKRRGYAVAIGHPKPVTIEALKAWIPTLAAKGITLVPVKSLLTVPKASAVIPVKHEVVPEQALPAVEPAAASVPVKSNEAPLPQVDMFPGEG